MKENGTHPNIFTACNVVAIIDYYHNQFLSHSNNYNENLGLEVGAYIIVWSWKGGGEVIIVADAQYSKG